MRSFPHFLSTGGRRCTEAFVPVQAGGGTSICLSEPRSLTCQLCSFSRDLEPHFWPRILSMMGLDLLPKELAVFVYHRCKLLVDQCNLVFFQDADAIHRRADRRI